MIKLEMPNWAKWPYGPKLGDGMIVPLEELLKNTQSHYKLVLAAAQRANELMKDGHALVVTKSKKPAVVALEEIAKGKVRCEEDKETAKSKKS